MGLDPAHDQPATETLLDEIAPSTTQLRGVVNTLRDILELGEQITARRAELHKTARALNVHSPGPVTPDDVHRARRVLEASVER